MSQTLSDAFARNLIARELYCRLPIDRESKTISDPIEEQIENLKEPLANLHNLIETLRPQLSDDRKIEINHTNEAILFCAEHTLIKYLGLAEKLIKENFPIVRKISFSVEYDPEISDQWVIADIEVFGEIDQVIAWEDEFVKEWVATVPYPERNMIRLSCDII